MKTLLLAPCSLLLALGLTWAAIFQLDDPLPGPGDDDCVSDVRWKLGVEDPTQAIGYRCEAKYNAGLDVTEIDVRFPIDYKCYTPMPQVGQFPCNFCVSLTWVQQIQNQDEETVDEDERSIEIQCTSEEWVNGNVNWTSMKLGKLTGQHWVVIKISEGDCPPDPDADPLIDYTGTAGLIN